MSRWLLPLALATTPLHAQAPDWTGQLDSIVTAALTRSGTPGASVAIVRNGRLVYSKGYGLADLETRRPVTPATLFRIGSATKMVTGATVAQLAATGVLDVQAPVGRYVPELQGRVATLATHQLLTHSGGLIDEATLTGNADETGLGAAMRALTDSAFFTEPGRVYSYSNIGFALAGYVAERAGGRLFADLVDSVLLRPAGMTTATFRPAAAMAGDFSQGYGAGSGSPDVVQPFPDAAESRPAGFLMASATEFARFAILVMDSGRVDGRQVLHPRAVAALSGPHVSIPVDDRSRAPGYGYGLRTTMRGTTRLLEHGGTIPGFDATVTMVPDQRSAVIVFDNRSGGPLPGVTEFALSRVFGIAPEPARTDPAPGDSIFPASAVADLVGTWRNGGVTMEIRAAGNGLILVRGGERPLVYVSASRMAVRSPTGGLTMPMVLVRDSAGRIRYLHLGGRSLARSATTRPGS